MCIRSTVSASNEPLHGRAPRIALFCSVGQHPARSGGGVTNRCFGKRYGTEGSSSARSRSRAVPCRLSQFRSLACTAACFLEFFKGHKTSSGEEGGCRGSAGARWFHDILSDKGGEKWDLAPCHIDGSRGSVEFTLAFTALCR